MAVLGFRSSRLPYLSINLSTSETRIEIELSLNWRWRCWAEALSEDPKRSQRYTKNMLICTEQGTHRPYFTRKKSKVVLHNISLFQQKLLSLDYSQCQMFSLHNTIYRLGNKLWRHICKCIILNGCWLVAMSVIRNVLVTWLHTS